MKDSSDGVKLLNAAQRALSVLANETLNISIQQETLKANAILFFVSKGIELEKKDGLKLCCTFFSLQLMNDILTMEIVMRRLTNLNLE